MITPNQYEIVVAEEGVTYAEIVYAPSILTAYRIARAMLTGNGKVSISVVHDGDLRKTFGPNFGDSRHE